MHGSGQKSGNLGRFKAPDGGASKHQTSSESLAVNTNHQSSELMLRHPPPSLPCWGRMTIHVMVCANTAHLSAPQYATKLTCI